MDGNTEHTEFETLLATLSDGRMSDVDHQRLSALLESDTILSRQYLEYCQMHSMLRSELGLLTALATPADEVADSRGQRLRKNISIVFTFAAAACLLLAAVGLGLFATSHPQRPHRGAETAVLSKVVGAQFEFGVD